MITYTYTDPRSIDMNKKEIKAYLSMLPQEKRKKRVCDMFDRWHTLKKSDPDKAKIYLKEIRVWDDIYHSLKDS